MRESLERNRWIAAMVAVLLLFATSGVAITKMTCLLGGHSVVSLGAAADCCPMEEHSTGATVSAECCMLSLAKGGDDPYRGHDDAAFVALFAVLEHAPFLLLGEAPVPAPVFSESRPPPLDASSRLAVLSTFLL